MGYCGNRWVSDYHFKKAFDHRLNGDGGVILDGASDASGVGARGDVLVVWGRVQDGRVMLDPAFLLNGPVALPDEEGPYRVEGIGADEQIEFSSRFLPRRWSTAEGASSSSSPGSRTGPRRWTGWF